jgi:hypothetical protein
VTLASCRIRIVRGHRELPRNGLWQIEQGNRNQGQENAERPGIAAGPFFFF